MEYDGLLSEIKNLKEYKTFIEENPQTYLAHIFIMERGPERDVEVGFFNPKDNKITSFSKKGITGSGKPLSGLKVEELDLNSIKIGSKQALAKAEEPIKSTITQRIIILQGGKEPVWNITLVTNTMRMTNSKVDAKTGSEISRKESNLLGLR